MNGGAVGRGSRHASLGGGVVVRTDRWGAMDPHSSHEHKRQQPQCSLRVRSIFTLSRHPGHMPRALPPTCSDIVA
jgi:hypothetical protein